MYSIWKTGLLSYAGSTGCAGPVSAPGGVSGSVGGQFEGSECAGKAGGWLRGEWFYFSEQTPRGQGHAQQWVELLALHTACRV